MLDWGEPNHSVVTRIFKGGTFYGRRNCILEDKKLDTGKARNQNFAKGKDLN